MVNIFKTTVDDTMEYDNIDEVLNDYASKGQSEVVKAIAKPDIDTYKHLECIGLLNIFIATSEDKLVGMIITMDTVLTHHLEMSTNVDAFYVSEEYRKYGTAKRLIDMAKQDAKDKGSIVMHMSLPNRPALSRVAKGFGFEPTSVNYSKSLLDMV